MVKPDIKKVKNVTCFGTETVRQPCCSLHRIRTDSNVVSGEANSLSYRNQIL